VGAGAGGPRRGSAPTAAARSPDPRWGSGDPAGRQEAVQGSSTGGQPESWWRTADQAPADPLAAGHGPGPQRYSPRICRVEGGGLTRCGASNGAAAVP